MENTVEGMKKKKTFSSLRKKATKSPHETPQLDVLGIIWVISSSQLMMNYLGINIQAAFSKCSMEGTLRNLSSIPWNTMP